MPLVRGRRGPRHPLPLVNAGQLRAAEVAKPLPDFREGRAGEFLVRRDSHLPDRRQRSNRAGYQPPSIRLANRAPLVKASFLG
jgi:hypothetical protein